MSPRVRDALASEQSRWVSSQVTVAEDMRFELMRACTQHAFQVCGWRFRAGQHRLRPWPRGLGRCSVNVAERWRMRLELRLEKRDICWCPSQSAAGHRLANPRFQGNYLSRSDLAGNYVIRPYGHVSGTIKHSRANLTARRRARHLLWRRHPSMPL